MGMLPRRTPASSELTLLLSLQDQETLASLPLRSGKQYVQDVCYTQATQPERASLKTQGQMPQISGMFGGILSVLR